MPKARVDATELLALVRKLGLVPQFVQQELEDEARAVKANYERTTTTWQTRPKFTITIGEGFAIVGTDDERYKWVDKGTQGHVITPKAPGYPLRFNSNFKAKTIPKKITSQQGFKRPPEVKTMKVRHPGVEARNFTELIQERSQKRLETSVKGLVRRLGGRI